MERKSLYLTITSNTLKVKTIVGIEKIKKEDIDYFQMKLEQVVEESIRATEGILNDGRCYFEYKKKRIKFAILFPNSKGTEINVDTSKMGNIDTVIETAGLGTAMEYLITIEQ